MSWATTGPAGVHPEAGHDERRPLSIPSVRDRVVQAARRTPKVTRRSSIENDVDLDHDDVRLSDGTRLTEQRAADLIGEIPQRGGRPSLSGQAAILPRVTFRLTPDIRDRAAALAESEGKTISQLAREALEARVAASRAS
ncbi:MAG: hypothetical protein ABI808_15025 [Pseudonocardiales bacterium]